MSEIYNINYVLAQIHDHFGFLFGDGFQVAKIFDKLEFANWIIVLRSETCIIRIVQDRGHLSMTVAPPWASIEIKHSEHFTDLELLVAFLDNEDSIVSSPEKPKSIDDRFAHLKVLLQSHYSQIVSMLNSENYTEKKKEIGLYQQNLIRKMYPNAKFISLSDVRKKYVKG